MADAEERFAYFRDLAPDWDSYGGNPPTEASIAVARRLVRTVCERVVPRIGAAARPFALAPTADGGVLVEWRRPARTVAILVDADGSLDYLLTEGQGAARQYREADQVAWETVLDLVAGTLDSAAGL